MVTIGGFEVTSANYYDDTYYYLRQQYCISTTTRQRITATKGERGMHAYLKKKLAKTKNLPKKLHTTQGMTLLLPPTQQMHLTLANSLPHQFLYPKNPPR